MLKLRHDLDLPAAFNATDAEIDMLNELIAQIAETKGTAKVTWAMQRLWIDERFSDNLKAMAIFLLGYSYCLQALKGGEHGRDSTS